MNSKSNNKCLNIQPLLYAYVDNELTDEQFDEVSSHLSECAHCRNTITNMYKVKDMVKMSYMPKEEVDFSKKIMANIQFNNKYSEKSKVKVNKSYGKLSSISKIVAGKLIYVSAVAALIVFVIGATVTYFEKTKPVSAEVVAQTYDKYEEYVIEHYANSYSGPTAQASVLSVNFEK